MIDGNIYTQIERHGDACLYWSNWVDGTGGRIEWRIDTDSAGWVSRYGAVHNDGVFSGSNTVTSAAEEKALLTALRNRLRRADRGPLAHSALAA